MKDLWETTEVPRTCVRLGASSWRAVKKRTGRPGLRGFGAKSCSLRGLGPKIPEVLNFWFFIFKEFGPEIVGFWGSKRPLLPGSLLEKVVGFAPHLFL